MPKYRLIETYEAPTPEDFRRLKDELGRNGTQMADLAGVSSNSQWRKYTGGANPRAMPHQSLFYLAAQLVLTPSELDRVIKKMIDIGARIE
ncbi:XRE family transcriptional regulator [Atlantibacter hermannii]|uniref:XRE family transcriptional regulator n=1 Tax=Atlantibacter hermannii TaxID=565 RepID=UPI0028B160DB|nr:XRE family transcriptional regulator [Atlantibacter hermannii]